MGLTADFSAKTKSGIFPFLQNKYEVVILSVFRLYYKTTIIKIVWISTNTDTQHQWNRRERPEINPHTYSQLFCNKEGKNTQ